MRRVEERTALNEATFRAANAKLEAGAREIYALDGGPRGLGRSHPFSVNALT